MLTNSYATLYNAYYDKELEMDLFKVTYLYGVNWQNMKAIAVLDKGVVSADIINVYVPKGVLTGDSVYISPKEWQKLTNRDGYYTFQNGDFIVRGTINFEITGERGHTDSDLVMNYDEVCKINSIIDNRQLGIGHWQIGELNMNIKLNLDSADEILGKRKLDGKAQKYFSSEIARLSEPYVPFRTGMLKNTVKVEEKQITYVQPYARRQWYENKGNGLRGKEWTIRMWNARKRDILKSVANYVGGEAK